MLSITVMNESHAISDNEIKSYLPAFDEQWNKDLRSIWSVDPAAFTFLSAGTAPTPGAWWVVFLDDSDQADALAYHDLTNEGLPISKVFVKTLQSDNASVSVGATHEICEMAVDPWLNSAYQDPDGIFWAGEVCDPVEDDKYSYKIGQIAVTDFVTPNWFAHKFSAQQMDFQSHARTAFEVLSGGYAQKFDPNRGWQQVTGALARRSARAAHAPFGSRRERRSRHWRNWTRSEAVWNR